MPGGAAPPRAAFIGLYRRGLRAAARVPVKPAAVKAAANLRDAFRFYAAPHWEPQRARLHADAETVIAALEAVAACDPDVGSQLYRKPAGEGAARSGHS